MSFTPTAAARWTTTSAWAARAATRGWWRIDPSTDRNPGLPRASTRFEASPVDRSSRTVTSSPRAMSASLRWDPMNPAPPVTR